jgi:hypothetical protein
MDGLGVLGWTVKLYQSHGSLKRVVFQKFDTVQSTDGPCDNSPTISKRFVLTRFANCFVMMRGFQGTLHIRKNYVLKIIHRALVELNGP